MMFSEVVTRYSPSFLTPYLETMVILLEYFKQTVLDMTQFVFQTFVFPPMAFTYDTSSDYFNAARAYFVGLKETFFAKEFSFSSFKSFDFSFDSIRAFGACAATSVKSVISNTCSGCCAGAAAGAASKNYASTPDVAEVFEMNGASAKIAADAVEAEDEILGEDVETSAQMGQIAKKSLDSNEDCCGSSFDGSSNPSITESSGGGEEKDVSEATATSGASGAAGINEVGSESNELDAINANEEVLNGNFGNFKNFNNFGQKNGFVAGQMKRINCVRLGVQDYVFEAWNWVKTLNLQKIENMCRDAPNIGYKAFDKVMNKIGYYRREYLMAYVKYARKIVARPQIIIDAAQDFVKEKYDLILEYKGEVMEYVEYGKERLFEVFLYLKSIFKEIRAGSFDYMQLMWDALNLTQKSLISLCKRYGSQSIFSKVVFKLNILQILTQGKKYLKPDN